MFAITTNSNHEFILVQFQPVSKTLFRYQSYTKLNHLTKDEKSFIVPEFTGRSFVSFNRVYNHLKKGMTPITMVMTDGRIVERSVYMVNEINR